MPDRISDRRSGPTLVDRLPAPSDRPLSLEFRGWSAVGISVLLIFALCALGFFAGFLGHFVLNALILTQAGTP